MPIIQINILEGRSPEKKQKLHELVCAAVVEALDAPPDAVRIQIIEMEPAHYSIGGVPKDQKNS